MAMFFVVIKIFINLKISGGGGQENSPENAVQYVFSRKQKKSFGADISTIYNLRESFLRIIASNRSKQIMKKGIRIDFQIFYMY